jgi:G protein-coupled receptor GPR1
MAPYMLGNWRPPQFDTSSTAHIMLEKLSRQAQNTDQSSSTPPDQGHVILIVAVTSAAISLIAALTSFRWFAIMKRSFRQHLIMLLMLSDSFKALWFLIFPLTIFTHGRVNSSSRFCQVGGFCIALAIEASDFASLMIAIHLALCVFGPQKPRGESGLWGYRRWIYPLWVALPILAASLAFTNHGNAYVAVGTFCYLPNQPLWYRLALAWIPRYIIFFTLFSVGSTITIHVHLKFKRFRLLGGDTSSAGQGFGRPAIEDQSSQGISSPPRSTPATPRRSLAHIWQHIVHQDHYRGQSQSSGHEPEFSSFGGVSSLVLLTETSSRIRDGIGPFDMGSAPASREPSQGVISPQPPSYESSPYASRKHSRVSFAPNHHRNSIASSSLRTDAATEELDTSRHAIEQHLRLLFVFPVAYTAIWAIPFISQCLQYTDKYALHQPYWLSITDNAMYALQAGVDALVFTLREQSWKRRRGNPLISVDKLRKMMPWSQSTKDEKGKMPATISGDGSVDEVAGSEQPLARTTVNWWEEEGKRRRDSVWMGTDKPYILKSCQEAEETSAERDEVQGNGDGERENKNSKGHGVTTQTFDHGMVYVKPFK